MSRLFFDLIQVSIGSKDQLSYTPSSRDWKRLYYMSRKQSLLGICCNGVQRVHLNNPEQVINLPNELMVEWFGHSVAATKQNELLNEYSTKTLLFFREKGLPCQILKGQGIAKLYSSSPSVLAPNSNLSVLRQSGDIDVWVSGGRKKVYALSREVLGNITGANYHHIHFPMYSGIEIEAHIYPSFLSSPFRNKYLHRFCEMHEPYDGCGDYPSLTFNRVFILLHCYRHLCGHGVGLRQLMDYYFVLNKGFTDKERTDTLFWCKKLGMSRFLGATMWVMKEVFGLADEYLLCKPDEREGRFLLEEVMYTGNMGHGETRYRWGQKSSLGRFMANQKRNLHLVTHYPYEVVWSPFFNIVRFIWLKCKGL